MQRNSGSTERPEFSFEPPLLDPASVLPGLAGRLT
jgi:hypothetical protein